MTRQCSSGRNRNDAVGMGRWAAGRLRRLTSCLGVAVAAVAWVGICPAL